MSKIILLITVGVFITICSVFLWLAGLYEKAVGFSISAMALMNTAMLFMTVKTEMDKTIRNVLVFIGLVVVLNLAWLLYVVYWTLLN